jgi:hypothetical protein
MSRLGASPSEAEVLGFGGILATLVGLGSGAIAPLADSRVRPQGLDLRRQHTGPTAPPPNGDRFLASLSL